MFTEGQKAAEQVSLQPLSLEQFLALCSPRSAVNASWMDVNTGGFFAYGKIHQERKGVCTNLPTEWHKLSVEELGCGHHHYLNYRSLV